MLPTDSSFSSSDVMCYLPTAMPSEQNYTRGNKCFFKCFYLGIAT